MHFLLYTLAYSIPKTRVIAVKFVSANYQSCQAIITGSKRCFMTLIFRSNKKVLIKTFSQLGGPQDLPECEVIRVDDLSFLNYDVVSNVYFSSKTNNNLIETSVLRRFYDDAGFEQDAFRDADGDAEVYHDVVGVRLVQKVVVVCYTVNDVLMDTCDVRLAFIPMNFKKGERCNQSDQMVTVFCIILLLSILQFSIK